MDKFKSTSSNMFRGGDSEATRAGYSQLTDLPEQNDDRAEASSSASASTRSIRGGESGMNSNVHTSVSQKKGKKSTRKQLWAILKKNATLKTKSRRSCCGCTIGGVPGVLFELLLPSLLILLLSIPKIFLSPIQFEELITPANETFMLESSSWLTSGCPNVTFAECADPEWKDRWDHGHVLFSPNTSVEKNVMDMVIKDISCPKAHTKVQIAYFYMFWEHLIDQGITPPLDCMAGREYCMNTEHCWKPLKDAVFYGFSTEEDALNFAKFNTTHTRAIVNFRDLMKEDTTMKYTLRMNHTMIPNTLMVNDVFSFNPQMKTYYYRHYWFFANFQLSMDRALIGNEKKKQVPADIDVNVHQFPAPAYSLNPDAIIAGSFMDICLVVAFLMPMRSNVASVVSEKELRLREGMRLLGVTDFSYWLSWVLTHGMEQTIISLCMSLFATITFPESDWHATFIVYLFLSMSLIPLAYVVSCFFQKTATAGPSVVLIFVCLMIPGMLVPVMQPYGGYGYGYASFLSPSCVAFSGTILRRLEYCGLGLTWETFTKPVILDGSLSAASLCGDLMRNAVLYTLLFLYLDRILPDEAGRRLPFYFPLTKSYWM